MAECKFCGYKIEEDDAFCGQCGKPVVENIEESCENCGKSIKSDNKFCVYCGHTLGEAIKERVVDAPDKAEVLVEAEEPASGIELRETVEKAVGSIKEEKAASPAEQAAEEKDGFLMDVTLDGFEYKLEMVEQEKEEWKKSLKNQDLESAPDEVAEEVEFVPQMFTEDITSEIALKKTSKLKYAVIAFIAILVIGVAFVWIKLLPQSVGQKKPGGILGSGAPDKNVEVSVTSVPATSGESEPSSAPVATKEFNYDARNRIIAQWDEVKSFDDNGLAWVMKGGRVGVIDMGGDYVVPLNYDSVGEFHEGLAIVSFLGKHGFVNSDGRIVLEPTYDTATAFSEGMSVVSQDGKYGFISTIGGVAIPLEYDYATKFSDGFAAVKQGNDTFFIDNKGEKVSENFDGAGYFSEGMAPVEMNEKWGYVDVRFQQIIGYEYEGASSFTDGVAIVTQGEKQFFIDKENNQKSPKVDQLWQLSEGLATVKEEELYGYVDGESIDYAIEPQYTNAYAYSQGFCTVQDVQGNWYYMDKNNKPAIEGTFDEAYRFSEDFARIRVGANYTIIDDKGNQAVEQVWEQVGSYSNKMLPVSESGMWGFVEIVAP